MCKLITIIRTGDKQDNLISELIKSQEGILTKEPHGIGALVINQDNTIEIEKSMTFYSDIYEWVEGKIPTSKIISIHTRTSTGGLTNLNNVHFFDIEGYYFGHNGIVSDYVTSKYHHSYGKENNKSWDTGHKYWESKAEEEADEYFKKGKNKKKKNQQIEDTENSIIITNHLGKEEIVDEDDMCDSYHFLRNLRKPVKNTNELEREMSKRDFYGVATLIDSNKKKMYTMGTREMSLHTDEKNFYMYYSFTPVSVIEKSRDLIGFNVKDGEKEQVPEITIKKGVYVYDYNK